MAFRSFTADSQGILSSDLEAVVLRCEEKYLGKRGWLKKVKWVLSGDDVHQHLTRIHEQIQMSYLKWMVGFWLRNGGLVTETLTATSPRSNCGQMRRLEHSRADLGCWKTSWSPSSRRCRVESDGWKEGAARKSKDRRRRNLGLKECTLRELLRLGLMLGVALE